MKRLWITLTFMFAVCISCICFVPQQAFAEPGATNWETPIIVNNVPNFTDSGPDSRNLRPGKFGSQYGRMLLLPNNDYLAAYTIYNNDGYLYDSNGGNELQVARSTDEGETWTVLTTISEPGRDLDNAQLLYLENGTILMSFRSVIWQQSYKIDLYKSTDAGLTWSYVSTIDENHGLPGELGNPDKGVYEPHMALLDNGDVGVMYASEKHVTASTPYAQTISMKTSNDEGETWSSEIWVAWDPTNANARPGMPVWTKMQNGAYIVVLEVCGTEDCRVYYKTSTDGLTWSAGIGTAIAGQRGAPYVLQMSDGRLAVTSNEHNISFSNDFGQSWYLDDIAPYGSLFDVHDNLWPSLYESSNNELIIMTSAGRSPLGLRTEGHRIELRKGSFGEVSIGVVSGAYYKLIAQHSGKNLDVDAGSGIDGANVQQWEINNLPPQIWQLNHVGNGYYKIKNQQSGKLLEVAGGSLLAGGNVQQWSDIDHDRQLWKIEHVGGGKYRISNKRSGLNLDVAAGSSANGANVHQWSDNGARPQRWKLEAVEGGLELDAVYKITNLQSNLVLEVDNGSLTAGANVQQGNYTSSIGQHWRISYFEGSYYEVTNVNSQQNLDVDAGVTYPGGNVQQWPDNDLPPQQWEIRYVGSNRYQFINRQSGLALDVESGVTYPGGNVQQWTITGLPPQIWLLEKL